MIDLAGMLAVGTEALMRPGRMQLPAGHGHHVRCQRLEHAGRSKRTLVARSQSERSPEARRTLWRSRWSPRDPPGEHCQRARISRQARLLKRGARHDGHAEHRCRFEQRNPLLAKWLIGHRQRFGHGQVIWQLDDAEMMVLAPDFARRCDDSFEREKFGAVRRDPIPERSRQLHQVPRRYHLPGPARAARPAAQLRPDLRLQRGSGR